MRLTIQQIEIRNRQRADLQDLDALAASIREFGQLVPVIVTKDHVLLDGQRRLEAIGRIGQDSVEVPLVSGAARQKWPHPSAKSVAMCEYFLRVLSIPGYSLLDSFCGSGAILEAGLSCGLRVTGIDQDQRYTAMSSARCYEWTESREEVLPL